MPRNESGLPNRPPAPRPTTLYAEGPTLASETASAHLRAGWDGGPTTTPSAPSSTSTARSRKPFSSARGTGRGEEAGGPPPPHSQAHSSTEPAPLRSARVRPHRRRLAGSRARPSRLGCVRRWPRQGAQRRARVRTGQARVPQPSRVPSGAPGREPIRESKQERAGVRGGGQEHVPQPSPLRTGTRSSGPVPLAELLVGEPPARQPPPPDSLGCRSRRRLPPSGPSRPVRPHLRVPPQVTPRTRVLQAVLRDGEGPRDRPGRSASGDLSEDVFVRVDPLCLGEGNELGAPDSISAQDGESPPQEGRQGGRHDPKMCPVARRG